MEVKIYECSICRRLSNANVKDVKRYIGTRKQIRKHLTDEHNIKGRKNRLGQQKKEFGPSPISIETRSREFK